MAESKACPEVTVEGGLCQPQIDSPAMTYPRFGR